jgi:hypothetical protein
MTDNNVPPHLTLSAIEARDAKTLALAKKLQKDQMQSAFCVMQEKFQPIKGVITKIGLAKVNPHEDIYMYHLK